MLKKTALFLQDGFPKMFTYATILTGFELEVLIAKIVELLEMKFVGK